MSLNKQIESKIPKITRKTADMDLLNPLSGAVNIGVWVERAVCELATHPCWSSQCFVLRQHLAGVNKAGLCRDPKQAKVETGGALLAAKC